MVIQLDVVEARVMGSLVEKELCTPEYYPLTISALTNACNQKSSREPIMSITEGEVARALSSLQAKKMVFQRSESGNRTPRFGHHIEILLEGGSLKEIAIITLLLLRGPQTSGEIRSRSGRLSEFESPAEIESILLALSTRPTGGLVVKFPRQAGQKEARWMHLFFGLEESKKVAESISNITALEERAVSDAKHTPDLSSILERLTRIEAKLDQLLGQ